MRWNLGAHHWVGVGRIAGSADRLSGVEVKESED